MKMKEGDHKYQSMLPEGLNEEDMELFRALAKFAFDSYHEVWSMKITFLEEDMPKGLIHFGFMNESTEMYAERGVERTFSFLHLSIQEYLAAWHLAHSYDIHYQMAYHGWTGGNLRNKEDQRIFYSIRPQAQPAIFLAGITGCRCQSDDSENPWVGYFGSCLCDETPVYEAQNPTLVSPFFGETSPSFELDPDLDPYGCYALSYCVANCQDKCQLGVCIKNNDDVSLLEIFVKGLDDHCKSKTPKVKDLDLVIENDSLEVSNNCLHWLTRAKCWAKLEELELSISAIDSDPLQIFLQSLTNLQSLKINIESPTTCEWLSVLKSLSGLKMLQMSFNTECSTPPTDQVCWLIENRLTEIELKVKFLPSTYDVDRPKTTPN
jgi:hypothetical protein